VDDSPSSGQVDNVNRTTWSNVAMEYAIEGWAEPGELAATVFVADRVRGCPILDLGVGGGRTVSLLRLLSSDYLAIDYTPELVEVCRHGTPTWRCGSETPAISATYRPGLVAWWRSATTGSTPWTTRAVNRCWPVSTGCCSPAAPSSTPR